MRVRPLLALAALSLLALPAQALAAPDRSVTLSAASPSANFSPPATSGQYLTFAPLINFDPAECSKEADTYCDQTLVHVQSGVPVKFDMALDGYGLPQDFDLYLYKSDAAGAIGAEVEPSEGSSVGNPPGDPETLVVDALDPGYYVALVAYFFVEEGTFNAAMKVTGATPVAGSPTPPPAGGPTPPPSGPPTPPSNNPTPPSNQPAAPSTLPLKAASSIGSAKRAKRSRRLALKLTATEDISGLTVKLVRPKRGTVGTVRAATFAKGTRTLRLRISKRAARALKRGTYQIVATGTVAGKRVSMTQAVKARA